MFPQLLLFPDLIKDLRYIAQLRWIQCISLPLRDSWKTFGTAVWYLLFWSKMKTDSTLAWLFFLRLMLFPSVRKRFCTIFLAREKVCKLDAMLVLLWNQGANRPGLFAPWPGQTDHPVVCLPRLIIRNYVGWINFAPRLSRHINYGRVRKTQETKLKKKL